MTPEERAVIDAALAWRDRRDVLRVMFNAEAARLFDAANALIKAREGVMWAPTICHACGVTKDGREIVAHMQEEHRYPR